MKGYQEEWQQTQLNNRFINFTNLTPGDYQFQIYSVTDNNQVSDVTSVNIKVEPKWFESIFFHIFIGLFIVLLLVALHRVRVLSISQSKKQLEDEIHRKTQQFEVLAKMGHDVSAIQSVNDLLSQLSLHLSETISFSQIAVGVCDFSEGTIKIHKASSTEKLKVPYIIEIDPHKELAAWCVRNNKMVHLNHYSDRSFFIEEASETDKDSNMQSILYFPLVSRHEQVLGCFSIQHERPNAYSEREIDFVSAVTNYAGIALDNTLAHRQFEQMKVTDPITGLINKPSFLSISEYQIKMCKRLSLPVSLIIADIDKFAQLNDQFGFKAGDKILRDLSTFLNETLRAQDLLSRFEGTHFVVLAPNTDALGAELLTYRIQKLLESKSFSSDQHSISLTLTFGVCQYEHRHSITQNIDRAEQALLKAKERGGNDTIIYSSLLRED